VVLAEHAAQVAAGEEDRARAVPPPQAVLLAKVREVRRNNSRAPDLTQALDVMQPVNPAQPRAHTAPVGTEQNPGLRSPPRDLVDAEADVRGARSDAVHGSTLKLGAYAAMQRIGDALQSARAAPTDTKPAMPTREFDVFSAGVDHSPAGARSIIEYVRHVRDGVGLMHSGGREFEIILAADDRDEDLWHAMSNRRIDPAKIHFDENTTVEAADLENEEYYVEGERLTEERAEQLAAEMLARVRAKNLRPGGKSLSGDGKHSPVVQVRVSEHTRDKLRAIAKARGMSVSKLSRKVLDEFVARETRV
jgi:hypothetical protein